MTRASFRIGDTTYEIGSCVLLHRGEQSLLLTPDERLVLLGAGSPKQLSGTEARRYLLQHGEAEIVEEFPELFRPAASANAERQPYLPLH
jgi:hypothetical protein